MVVPNEAQVSFDSEGLDGHEWKPSRRQRRAADAWNGLTLSMFWQDVEHLLPFSHDGDWRVVVTSEGKPIASEREKQFRAHLTVALSRATGMGHHYPHRSLEEAIDSFLGFVSQNLVVHGRIRFEVCYLPVTDLPEEYVDLLTPKGEPAPVEEQVALLVPLDEGSLRRFFNVYTQSTRGFPAGVATHRRILPVRSVLVFRPPAFYRFPLRRAVRALRVDAKTSPIQMLEAQHRGHSYEAKRHDNDQRLALAQATARIGYTIRDYVLKDPTDPYRAYRQLRFRAFQVALRDNILGQLNTFLSNAGHIFGGSFLVQLEGCITAAEVKQLEEELVAGTTKTIDIFRRALRGA